MNKKGFISIALVYSFLIIFLLVMLSITAIYVQKDKYIKVVINQVKDELVIRE